MSTKNPWKTLGSSIVYRNDWIVVQEDRVVRPDGEEGIYGIVKTRLATGVVAMTPEQEIYLVGQYRYTMGEYSWEIIEGGNDPGETALEAAQRELAEEAGLAAEHWQPLGHEIHLSNCHSDERGYLFLATGLSPRQAAPEETEILQLKKVPLTEALAMVDRGEIKDAVSIMGLLTLDRLRQAGQLALP